MDIATKLPYLVAAALSLAGCYSVQSLEQSEPIKRFNVAADWRAVSACVALRLPIDFGNLERREEKHRATVTMFTGGGISIPVFVWQAAFTPTGGGATLVEIRSANSLWGPMVGDDGPIATPLFAAIDSCVAEPMS